MNKPSYTHLVKDSLGHCWGFYTLHHAEQWVRALSLNAIKYGDPRTYSIFTR